MENKNLPKVLVVSINAWRDNTGINTLIDFFKCWDSDKIAQIYTRAALPKTTVCNNFFRIPESSIIRSIIKRNTKTGSIVKNEINSINNNTELNNENRIYSHSHNKLNSILSLCREIVWKIGKWKTAELNEFIDNFDADVLFIPIYPTIYMGRIQKYVMKRTGKPVVSYLADDNFTFKAIAKEPFSFIHRLFLRPYIKYIVKNSKKLLVISPKQKDEYDKLFNTDCEIMTKGIDFSTIPYEQKPLNSPIKMVYTGKLIIGRWLSLAKIAETMDEINKDGVKIEFDIYTTDTLTSEQKSALNRNGCQVKGSLTLDEVQIVQKNADILVFVESLENKFKHTARLSFSTKITDYLKNGKCIFAIGDKEIAPIDYFNRYDSAITATTYPEIDKKLKKLVESPNLIVEYSKKAYDCGVAHHNSELMTRTLIDTISGAAKQTKRG